jgi:hypothetical protein
MKLGVLSGMFAMVEWEAGVGSSLTGWVSGDLLSGMTTHVENALERGGV